MRTFNSGSYKASTVYDRLIVPTLNLFRHAYDVIIATLMVNNVQSID